MKLFWVSVCVVASSGMAVAQNAPVVPVVPLEVTVGSNAVLSSVLLDRIKKGETTAQAAWESGELDEATVLFLLENTSQWGALPGGDDDKLRRELGMLVARHAPEKLEESQLKQLPLKVRLWVGDALGDAGDAQAVTVLGSVIDEIKGRAKADDTNSDANTLAFLSIERLAWFY